MLFCIVPFIFNEVGHALSEIMYYLGHCHINGQKHRPKVGWIFSLNKGGGKIK